MKLTDFLERMNKLEYPACGYSVKMFANAHTLSYAIYKLSNPHTPVEKESEVYYHWNSCPKTRQEIIDDIEKDLDRIVDADLKERVEALVTDTIHMFEKRQEYYCAEGLAKIEDTVYFLIPVDNVTRESLRAAAAKLVHPIHLD